MIGVLADLFLTNHSVQLQSNSVIGQSAVIFQSFTITMATTTHPGKKDHMVAGSKGAVLASRVTLPMKACS